MYKTVLMCLALVLMVSCSSEKKAGTEAPSQSAAKQAVKETQYDTGRTAFQRIPLPTVRLDFGARHSHRRRGA